MCKRILVLLLSVLALHLGTSVALADGAFLPEPLSPDYLVVRYHRVTVRITDGYAVTRVEQAFYNPYAFPVVGRYLFPVPPGAAVSGFQATVDGRTQRVEHQGPAATNATIFRVVAERADPSLLQYADWESLAFDIDVPPGGSREMTLEYEQFLVPAGGLYHYNYVLSTERYSGQPLEEVSVDVELRSSAGLASVYSSSHPVTVERPEPGHARVSWKARDVRPSEDFDLFFAPAEGGFGGGLLTGERNGEGHFLFLFSPEATTARGEVIPKEIVFVFDRSGSMAGEKFEQARNALHYVLGRLNEGDRFSIVSFNQGLAVFAQSLRPADEQSLAEARRFVDGLGADGNTDLEAALQEGLAILTRSESRPGALRTIVFLTDGLPTAGFTDDGLIAKRIAKANGQQQARLHVFGVGYDVNTHLLDRLAVESGGTVTYVQPGENLEAFLTGFYDRVAYPVLTDVTVQFEGMEASLVYPETMPDLFQGTSLLLAGRYRATAQRVTVRVQGLAGDELRTYVYRFDLKEAGGHDFVPRLWATRRIGALLDRVRVEGESQDLVDEIRQLGLGYGVVTPYTTFVIEGQAEGAASAANMALYGNAELNQAWGKTTVQARVQNQMYQQATQAGLAAGANVLNKGPASLAQNGDTSVDLNLLQGQTVVDDPVTLEWVERNVGIDRAVAFASEEYFALARDPQARVFLQGGANVVFALQGEVIAVQHDGAPVHYDGPALDPMAPFYALVGRVLLKVWEAVYPF